jgi:hypothetical protein
VKIGGKFVIGLSFNIRKKSNKINGVETGIGQIPDVIFRVVKLWVPPIFQRNDAGAQLIDVTAIFEEECNKLANLGVMVVADVFGQALCGGCKDGCCVCSRYSCTTDGQC